MELKCGIILKVCEYFVTEDTQKRNVTYDSKNRDGVFKVHTNQEVVEFIAHESGLHYLDLKNNEDAGVTLVTMIRENFEGYTKKQFDGGIKAHCFQAMLGCPSRKDFEGVVCDNLIANCQVTMAYISHAYLLFGESLAI